jgi:hypothetical protein
MCVLHEICFGLHCEFWTYMPCEKQFLNAHCKPLSPSQLRIAVFEHPVYVYISHLLQFIEHW